MPGYNGRSARSGPGGHVGSHYVIVVQSRSGRLGRFVEHHFLCQRRHCVRVIMCLEDLVDFTANRENNLVQRV